MPKATVRETVAWLLWCANQGYLHPDDRALVDNHFLPDAGPQHPDDLAEMPHWRRTVTSGAAPRTGAAAKRGCCPPRPDGAATAKRCRAGSAGCCAGPTMSTWSPTGSFRGSGAAPTSGRICGRTAHCARIGRGSARRYGSAITGGPRRRCTRCGSLSRKWVCDMPDVYVPEYGHVCHRPANPQIDDQRRRRYPVGSIWKCGQCGCYWHFGYTDNSWGPAWHRVTWWNWGLRRRIRRLERGRGEYPPEPLS